MSCLPNPAVYFPLAKARFTVTPGFHLITQSFGNGAMDARLFQIDAEYDRFRQNKVAARAERLAKYVCFSDGFAEVAPAVCRLLMMRLFVEYPAYFDLTMEAGGAGSLLCHLTGERLVFSPAMALLSVESTEPVAPAYTNTFDALIAQVPEDVAVIALPDTAPDASVALHVCAPSHWSPEEKIGASFTQTHAPVPGFDKIAAASAALLETVRTRPPLVRFNWGIEFADRLNLHPEPPPGVNVAEWNRRAPCLQDPAAVYLRVERQVLWGMETARAAVFAIRVYTRPVSDLSATERDAVRETLLSMPEANRLYKGLPLETWARVVQILRD